jgi:hypothetical protein
MQTRPRRRANGGREYHCFLALFCQTQIALKTSAIVFEARRWVLESLVDWCIREVEVVISCVFLSMLIEHIREISTPIQVF